MTYASATAVRRNSYQRNKNSVNYQDNKSTLGVVSNFAVLLALGCLLTVVYLSQVTKTNSYSYSLDQLNRERVELQQDLDALQVSSARLQSISQLKDSQVASNLATPENVSYAN